MSSKIFFGEKGKFEKKSTVHFNNLSKTESIHRLLKKFNLNKCLK